MTTMIQLSDRELDELKSLTTQPDAESAVQMAVREFLRFAKRMRLKELSGQVEMESNWGALERAELEGNEHGSAGAG